MWHDGVVSLQMIPFCLGILILLLDLNTAHFLSCKHSMVSQSMVVLDVLLSRCCINGRVSTAPRNF
jgi:hypothetical protein